MRRDSHPELSGVPAADHSLPAKLFAPCVSYSLTRPVGRQPQRLSTQVCELPHTFERNAAGAPAIRQMSANSHRLWPLTISVPECIINALSKLVERRGRKASGPDVDSGVADYQSLTLPIGTLFFAFEEMR